MTDPDHFDFGDDVDKATFEQILDMDDPDDDDDPRQFSKSIVFGFMEQAEQTFNKMDDAMGKKDLAELSSLGHFLKGSSATLGFTKVKDECEKIQHYGHNKDATGEIDEKDDKVCLDNIAKSIKEAKTVYNKVHERMNKFYADS